MRYLLDSNICIYYIKGLYNLDTKVKNVGDENCFISEITLAELKYGVANSENKKNNNQVLDNFVASIKVVPIYNSLDLYASEKARLKKDGNIIDDFDLLIGVSAISNKMVLVTNNTKHMERLTGIELEDWTK